MKKKEQKMFNTNAITGHKARSKLWNLLYFICSFNWMFLCWLSQWMIFSLLTFITVLYLINIFLHALINYFVHFYVLINLLTCLVIIFFKFSLILFGGSTDCLLIFYTYWHLLFTLQMTVSWTRFSLNC